MHKPERNVLKWWRGPRIEARSLDLARFWSPPAVMKNKGKGLGGVAKSSPNRAAYVSSSSFSKSFKVVDSAKTDGWIYGRLGQRRNME